MQRIFLFYEVQFITFFLSRIILSLWYLKSHHKHKVTWILFCYRLDYILCYPLGVLLLRIIHVGYDPFWVNLCESIRFPSTFILLHVDIQLSNIICWKVPFFLWDFLCSFIKDHLAAVCVGLFLRSLFCFIDMFVLLPVLHCYVYCNFIISLKFG